MNTVRLKNGTEEAAPLVQVTMMHLALRWEPGVAEVGFLRGWTAGDAIAHCGCVLAEHEVAALAAKAEEESNGT
jgi:hypothetical protein